MQDTSSISNYDSIVASGDYSEEAKIVIDNVEYGEDQAWTAKTAIALFENRNPTIGLAQVREIDVRIPYPLVTIPRTAEIRMYTRLIKGSTKSGWLPKGVFYIDSRVKDEDSEELSIHGYDAMLRAEADYPSSALAWTSTSPNARAVLNEIAAYMGVDLDDRTKAAIPTNTPYIVGFPAQYTIREVLGSIAAMYCGNFIMSDEGKLLLVGFNDLPEETRYLITNSGNYITFGGYRILRY